jgi:hypothetical protein
MYSAAPQFCLARKLHLFLRQHPIAVTHISNIHACLIYIRCKQNAFQQIFENVGAGFDMRIVVNGKSQQYKPIFQLPVNACFLPVCCIIVYPWCKIGQYSNGLIVKTSPAAASLPAQTGSPNPLPQSQVVEQEWSHYRYSHMKRRYNLGG